MFDAFQVVWFDPVRNVQTIQLHFKTLSRMNEPQDLSAAAVEFWDASKTVHFHLVSLSQLPDYLGRH